MGHKVTAPFMSLFLVHTGPSPQSAEKKVILMKTLTYSHLFPRAASWWESHDEKGRRGPGFGLHSLPGASFLWAPNTRLCRMIPSSFLTLQPQPLL